MERSYIKSSELSSPILDYNHRIYTYINECNCYQEFITLYESQSLKDKQYHSEDNSYENLTIEIAIRYGFVYSDEFIRFYNIMKTNRLYSMR